MDTQESKNKTCQNCKAEFTIEPEDFDFYKKIDVPEPTFCPDCRLQRRMAWRNERKLYKRKCDHSGEEILSIYHPESEYKVFEREIWWSDKWDPMEYGREYDLEKPFFEQLSKLVKDCPWPSLIVSNATDSSYCNYCEYAKNCYLCFASHANENLKYSIATFECKDSLDLHRDDFNEACYENVDCKNCFKVFFSQYAIGCNSSTFLYNCRNCSDCFGCVNLRNKKYHIFNKPFSKEQYQQEVKKYNLANKKELAVIKDKFEQFKLKFPFRFANLYKTENVTGDNVNNAKNCQECFDLLEGVEDCKFSALGGVNLKDTYDMYGGGDNCDLMYEGANIGIKGSRILFSAIAQGSNNVEHCFNCHSCNDCFACVGLRHKQYCIFNKQHSEEEYKKLVAEIKRHMDEMPFTDKKGNVYKYGELLPIELMPFGYNETAAFDQFPLTKQEALDAGYGWHDKSRNEYKPTIEMDKLPDEIEEVDDSVTKEIIKCENPNCLGVGAFQIVPGELNFYKKHRIALPSVCPECRFNARIKKRNPMKLHKRQCMCGGGKDVTGAYENQQGHEHGERRCENEFETTYAPDRKEIVYCKECYQKEVE